MATAIMKQKEVPEMDDVEEIISKISEESPYRRHPTQKRTWMTVPEMGKLLGFPFKCRQFRVLTSVIDASEDIYTADYQVDADGQRTLYFAKGALVATVTRCADCICIVLVSIVIRDSMPIILDKYIEISEISIQLY